MLTNVNRRSLDRRNDQLSSPHLPTSQFWNRKRILQENVAYATAESVELRPRISRWDSPNDLFSVAEYLSTEVVVNPNSPMTGSTFRNTFAIDCTAKLNSNVPTISMVNYNFIIRSICNRKVIGRNNRFHCQTNESQDEVEQGYPGFPYRILQQRFKLSGYPGIGISSRTNWS